MDSAAPTSNPRPIGWSAPAFLRASEGELSAWVVGRGATATMFCIVAVAAGAGMFGAALGWWRSPTQAVFTAVKLPLVLLLTTLGNGLLNGMLAPLLGLRVTFRQSLALVLTSFAITSFVLGGLAPVTFFVVWNTPSLTAATRAWSPEYAMLQLTLTAFLAFAGITGNVRLYPLLQQWTDNKWVALRALFAWLATNLFLGSQVSWSLRPFIWDPNRPVEFICPDWFKGSFYETVFEALRRVAFH